MQSLSMKPKELIYEGKAKKVYTTEDDQQYIIYFKDDATAYNAQKKGQIEEKGILNNKISSIIFQYLSKFNIPHHYIKTLSEREQLVKKVDIIPLEFVVRNYVAGSMAKRLGLSEGKKCPVVVYDICYKNDALGDPLINDHHAVLLGIASYDELKSLYAITEQINSILVELFDKMNIILVDFKLEFGKDANGNLLLADEISPDSCRLWDKQTFKKLDKDRFRRDLGEVKEAYQEIYYRLDALVKNGLLS